jgi:hypothetical protein
VSEPTRYTAAGNGVVRTDPQGALIAYGHYEELKAENARLKAEVERLTKAGDAMADSINGDYNYSLPCIEAWEAAKKGGQP